MSNKNKIALLVLPLVFILSGCGVEAYKNNDPIVVKLIKPKNTIQYLKNEKVNDQGGFLRVQVFEDDEYNVRCWFAKNSYGGGLSCIKKENYEDNN